MCMYNFVYIVYLQTMLITYINLSDSRPIIQSATLQIHTIQRKVFNGIAIMSCFQNLMTLLSESQYIYCNF